MNLKPVDIDIAAYPGELQPLLSGASIYDSSCSAVARVIFIDKDNGYFLKSAPKGSLEREAIMMRYFSQCRAVAPIAAHGKRLNGVSASRQSTRRLSAEVLAYISDEQDWLLTEKIHGDDCTAAKYLEEPEKLCDIAAECLVMLHETDFTGCPFTNNTEQHLANAARNKEAGAYNKSHFPDSWGYTSEAEAWGVIEKYGGLLKTDTLLHGDYCLPNIILNNWRFAGFIDLDSSGVGDRHFDLFWGMWSLNWNLKTDKYRNRFLDAYGRSKVDEDMLRVVAAIEVFG